VSAPSDGWYIDPENQDSERYWNGGDWTDHRRPTQASLQRNLAPTQSRVPITHSSSETMTELQVIPKVRSRSAIVWLVAIFGWFYASYWWYAINRDIERFGRFRQSEETGTSPTTSLIAVTIGWFLVIPPFISLHRGIKRLNAASRLAGRTEHLDPMGLVGISAGSLIAALGVAILVPKAFLLPSLVSAVAMIYVLGAMQKQANLIWADLRAGNPKK